MQRLLFCLLAFPILLAGCSNTITLETANDIALNEFQEKYTVLETEYFVETNEVYTVTEEGKHIRCYKVIFFDQASVPIATFLISKKDGKIVKQYSR
ncbi:hypothetical protein U9M73_09135 [Paenibacillus phoenicis]|uniref:Lipoprotein n=2 Tax=Paenibacillus TaxID=44249 RepID=A0ABU5PK88_9BACL|nr:MULTISPECIES: hypothetical protein [Paenibacillus]MCT2197525.1 hypothetical protein [Paenibacillus sp. p3-SID1389]MEA3570167.1 hypothetical protein [Paenibacillus phoenicis]